MTQEELDIIMQKFNELSEAIEALQQGQDELSEKVSDIALNSGDGFGQEGL